MVQMVILKVGVGPYSETNRQTYAAMRVHSITRESVRSTSVPSTKAPRHYVKINSDTGAITVPDGDPLQDTDIENDHDHKREVSQSVNNVPTAATPGIAVTILQSLTLVTGGLFIETRAAQIVDQLNIFHAFLSHMFKHYYQQHYIKHINFKFLCKPTLTSRAPESITYYSSIILRSNVDEIATPSSVSVTVDLSTDTGVTLYGEWSTTITFDTTKRSNFLLLQDGRTVIIVGSNPTPCPTARAPIEISFSVSTITNGVINNDVSTIAFDTDTKVRVYAEVEESEDQIAEFVGMFFDRENFGALYPGRRPSLDCRLVIMVNDTINERGYYVDFTTTALFNRFGAEFRFAPRIRGAIIDSFTFQRAGGTVEEGVQFIVNDCDSYFGTNVSTLVV